MKFTTWPETSSSRSSRRDSFQPERKPARWNVLAQKHPDQIIVTTATAETSREILNVDLHDRAGVIRKSTRKTRIDLQLLTNARRLSEVDDRLQLVNAFRAEFVVADELYDPAKDRSIQSLLCLIRDFRGVFQLVRAEKKLREQIRRLR